MVKPMPVLPPEDGIERHNAYFRLNPNGDKEFVDEDEETLNELAESLRIEAENFFRDKLQALLPGRLSESDMQRVIDDGLNFDDILHMFEGIDFSGPLPTGGGAGSAEQLEYERRHNRFTPQMTGSEDDPTREAGEDVNNSSSSMPVVADGPDRSHAKYGNKAGTFRGVTSRNKYISGYNGDSLNYGATSEAKQWSIHIMAESIE